MRSYFRQLRAQLLIVLCLLMVFYSYESCKVSQLVSHNPSEDVITSEIIKTSKTNTVMVYGKKCYSQKQCAKLLLLSILSLCILGEIF